MRVIIVDAVTGARRILGFVLLLCVLSAADVPVVGPSNGTLIAAGGGRLGVQVLERFIELAGGRDSAFVIIPTADPEIYPTPPEDSFLARAGCKDVTILNTSDRVVANSEDFVKPLRRARGVWVHGGQKWRLVDAYLHSQALREMWGVLERGGVIGGSSSGASIQGSYLVRGGRNGPETMMAPGYEEGFGFLRGVAIDQHLLTRHRETDMLTVIAKHPDLLGVGIDEGTAIVIQGDRFEVIGVSKVAIYNPAQTGFYFLSPGDRFNLHTRQTEP